MNLMPKKIRDAFPKWMSTDEKNHKDIPVIVKYFNPCGIGTWYITEFDGKDRLYGLCCIQMAEFGYVSLSELEKINVGYGLKIERDLFWKGSLADALKIEKVLTGTLMGE